MFLENKFIKNLQLLKQKLCKNTISIMKGLYIRVSNTGFLGPGLGAQWVRRLQKRNLGSWISPDFVVLVNCHMRLFKVGNLLGLQRF